MAEGWEGNVQGQPETPGHEQAGRATAAASVDSRGCPNPRERRDTGRQSGLRSRHQEAPDPAEPPGRKPPGRAPRQREEPLPGPEGCLGPRAATTGLRLQPPGPGKQRHAPGTSSARAAAPRPRDPAPSAGLPRAAPPRQRRAAPPGAGGRSGSGSGKGPARASSLTRQAQDAAILGDSRVTFRRAFVTPSRGAEGAGRAGARWWPRLVTPPLAPVRLLAHAPEGGGASRERCRTWKRGAAGLQQRHAAALATRFSLLLAGTETK